MTRWEEVMDITADALRALKAFVRAVPSDSANRQTQLALKDAKDVLARWERLSSTSTERD